MLSCVSFCIVVFQELYSSVEKMRPQLFKMASELQPNEEGMTEILQSNDALIRVLEYYKRIFKPDEVSGTEQTGTTVPTLPPSTTTTTSATGGATAVTENPPRSPTGAELLLDLTDLNFNAPTLPSGGNDLSVMSNGLGATGTSETTPTSGLMNDFSLLGKLHLMIAYTCIHAISFVYLYCCFLLYLYPNVLLFFLCRYFNNTCSFTGKISISIKIFKVLLKPFCRAQLI